MLEYLEKSSDINANPERPGPEELEGVLGEVAVGAVTGITGGADAGGGTVEAGGADASGVFGGVVAVGAVVVTVAGVEDGVVCSGSAAVGAAASVSVA